MPVRLLLARTRRGPLRRAARLAWDDDDAHDRAKRAEERDELVVRLLNASSEPESATLRPLRRPTSARLLRIDETPVDDDALPLDGRSVTVDAAPWQIVTVGLGFQP